MCIIVTYQPQKCLIILDKEIAYKRPFSVKLFIFKNILIRNRLVKFRFVFKTNIGTTRNTWKTWLGNTRHFFQFLCYKKVIFFKLRVILNWTIIKTASKNFAHILFTWSDLENMVGPRNLVISFYAKKTTRIFLRT